MSDDLGFQNRKTEGELTAEMLKTSRNLVSGAWPCSVQDFLTGDSPGPGGTAVGDFSLSCGRAFEGGVSYSQCRAVVQHPLSIHAEDPAHIPIPKALWNSLSFL